MRYLVFSIYITYYFIHFEFISTKPDQQEFKKFCTSDRLFPSVFYLNGPYQTKGLIIWKFSSRDEISTQYTELKKTQLYEKLQPRLKYNSFKKN